MASDTLRVFGEAGSNPASSAWVYGPGTHNPDRGDYYHLGRYSEPASPAFETCLRHHDYYRELTMDEALARGVPFALFGPTVDDGL